METMIQARGVPGTITQPRKVSGPGAQPSHRARIAPISCQVR